MEYIRVHSLHYPIQIISWQVKKGQHVSKDEKLGIYAYLDEEVQLYLMVKVLILARTKRKNRKFDRSLREKSNF